MITKTDIPVSHDMQVAMRNELPSLDFVENVLCEMLITLKAEYDGYVNTELFISKSLEMIYNEGESYRLMCHKEIAEIKFYERKIRELQQKINDHLERFQRGARP